jgi:hypothetical protein
VATLPFCIDSVKNRGSYAPQLLAIQATRDIADTSCGSSCLMVTLHTALCQATANAFMEARQFERPSLSENLARIILWRTVSVEIHPGYITVPLP